MCASIAVEPNYPSLRMYGKAEEICRGVNLARKKINKYYELAKQIPLYCIATGIFLPFFCITIPLTFFSLKYWTLDLKYFMEAGWPRDQIENSRKCVEQVWKALYKPSCSTQPVPDNGKTNIAEQLWAYISSSEVNIDFKEIYPNSNLF